MTEPTVTLPRSMVEKVREALDEITDFAVARTRRGSRDHRIEDARQAITLLDAALAQPGDGWRDIASVPINEVVLVLMEADKDGPPLQGLIQTGARMRVANGHVWIIANMNAWDIGGKPVAWQPLPAASDTPAPADTRDAVVEAARIVAANYPNAYSSVHDLRAALAAHDRSAP